MLTARRLASIVESSEVAIVGKRLDGIIESWNAAAERLFGYAAAEAIGRHISLVIPPERLAEEDRIIATLKAGPAHRALRDGARAIATAAASSVSLSVSPIKDDDGNVIGASKIARDITRERQAEAERNRLITLIENSRDFIGIYGLDGAPIFVNHAGSSWSASTARGRTARQRGTSFSGGSGADRDEFVPAVGRRGTPRSKSGFAISEPAPRAGWRTSCSRSRRGRQPVASAP